MNKNGKLLYQHGYLENCMKRFLNLFLEFAVLSLNLFNWNGFVYMYVKDCSETYIWGRKESCQWAAGVSVFVSHSMLAAVSHVSLKLPQYQIGSFDVCEYFTSEYYKLLAYILFSD